MADPRIKLQFYTENISPYRRWNDGADLAQGEYLQIVCADDSCHPTLLERLIEKLDNNPSVGLAYSQAWEIDDQGTRLRSFQEWTDYLDKNRWSQDFVDIGKK
ncbi:MAG: glycosyltransferase family 2 protein [Leptolyngbyaceae cyanobacterium CRU_2_3]|nr:glycosyltransferase family 2 protein [Leptolyngbyaceae cyanobacterium CRU_2_3]